MKAVVYRCSTEAPLAIELDESQKHHARGGSRGLHRHARP